MFTKILKMVIRARHQWLTLAILATQEAEIGRITVGSQLGKQFVRLYLKNYPTQKRAGRVALVVKCLPTNCEALSLNPSITKKNGYQGIAQFFYCYTGDTF
jgi:hypothetical protein